MIDISEWGAASRSSTSLQHFFSGTRDRLLGPGATQELKEDTDDFRCLWLLGHWGVIFHSRRWRIVWVVSRSHLL